VRIDVKAKLLLGGAAIFLVGAASLMPAAAQDPIPGIGVTHMPMQPRRNPDGSFARFKGTITTSSWAGYAVTAGAPYTSASTTWQVPDVSYDGGQTPYGYEYVLNWTGIGGYGDSTLIQLGTESWVSTSGVRSFGAWYELYPAYDVGVALTVKPGDIVTASLQCTAACSPSQPQTWQLTLTNNTTGEAWTQSFQYQSSMASAEAVAEPPYYNPPGFLPLANYGNWTVNPFTANGSNPNLSLLSNGIIAATPYGETSNPSAPANGDTFSVCWGASGASLTNCTAGSFTTTPPVVTASLSASPTSISPGQSSTLSWTSTNATWCTGGNFTASGTSGSAVVMPSVTTSYSVTCTDGADPATAMATVTVSSTTGNGHGHKH
jgi:peptidase A4-like protein